MSISDKVKENAAQARRLYLEARDPLEAAQDWRFALREARRLIADTFRASDYLNAIEGALTRSGAHILVLRHLMAPPISQDQLKIVCRAYPKGNEKSGVGLSAHAAKSVTACFDLWRDRRLTLWLDENRKPEAEDIRQTLTAVSPLIAYQRLSTSKRNRLAAAQEKAVVDLLIESGWKKLPSRLIDTRAALAEKHFQHKTRFATNTTAPQEVDIACGLRGTVVLAMECKVTNDETNSVKRINDVLKKSTAWKDHWGSFVKTAALLQGVVAPKDVQRLMDAGVEIFWSHDLNEFSQWLRTQL